MLVSVVRRIGLQATDELARYARIVGILTRSEAA